MSRRNRVLVVWPSGRESFMQPLDAVEHVKSGDAELLGKFSIRMLKPRLRYLRGPSCAASGAARGRGEDGTLTECYIEQVLRRPRELAAIRALARRPIVTETEV